MRRGYLAGGALIAATAAAIVFVVLKQFHDEAAKDASCTLAGCTSGVAVLVRDPPVEVASATLCRDEVCSKGPVRKRQGGLYDVPCEPEPATVLVTLTLRDRRGGVIDRVQRSAELEKNQPNGPDCDPTCWAAGFIYDGRTGRLARQ